MSAAVFLAAALTFLNGIADTLSVLAAVFLHEGGHAAACRLFRVPILFFHPVTVGAVIGYDAAGLSFPKEIAIASAGPLVNLVSAAACLFCRNRFFMLFAAASLSLALFNLLPLRHLDGGVILFAAVSLFRGAEPAARITRIFSVMGTFFVWMCAVAVQLRCGGNLSLLLVSVYLLLRL